MIITAQLATIDDVNKINDQLVDMTGATSDEAGKAGFVPAPAAGEQEKFFAGDGTWKMPKNTTYSAATQTKSGLMSAADKKAHDQMVTDIGTEDISGIGDGTIKGAIAYLKENGGSGGGGGIPLAQPTGVSLTNADEAVTIKWTDPEDAVIDGITLAKWSGTLVVRKAGSAPTSKTDGVVVVDSKTRDAYKTTGFKDTGLTNDTEYYYGIFPYTTGNVYTYDYTDSITPVAIYPTAPSGVSVSGGNTEITVTFTKPSDATGIRIVYGTTSPTGETDGTVIDTTASPYTITGLTNDTEYFVRVYSYNAKGRFTASDAISVTPKALTIVTWANGSLEDIAKMLEAHYAGTIDVADYWAVGDTKTISLSAMAATGVGESHDAQNVELTIIGIKHDNLKSAVNGKTKAAITVQMKNCLNNAGYMFSAYNSPSYSLWSDSPRRTWCNNIFKSSLPTALKNIIKTVTKKTWRYCHSNYSNYSNYRTQQNSEDDCFLLSEFEVFGTQGLSSSTYGTVGDDGTQYDYYKTTSNRVKNKSGSAYYWWLRSSYVDSSGNSRFRYVTSDGTVYSSNIAGSAVGLAVGFCL